MSNNTSIHVLADVQSAHIGAGTRIWQYVVVLPEAHPLARKASACGLQVFPMVADMASTSGSEGTHHTPRFTATRL